MSDRTHDLPVRPPALHRFLLRCYPAAWRERYGGEFLALLEQRPPGIRQAVDIIGAAVDARTHPQLRAGAALVGEPVAGPRVPLLSVPQRSISITCRCHGSTYNILGEKLKEGPAERGMDRFAVDIGEDGTVVIDTSRIVAGAPDLGLEHVTFVDPFPYDIKCP